MTRLRGTSSTTPTPSGQPRRSPTTPGSPASTAACGCRACSTHATGRLTFEHLGHRHPQPHDLPVLADALGALHAAAHRDHLSEARLDQPFHHHHRTRRQRADHQGLLHPAPARA